MSETAWLLLEDGSVLRGHAFGARGVNVAGEVVFNTAMTGYVETLTDPSYAGQILISTYPLIGNYGVPAPREQGTLAGPYESDRIQTIGLIVQSYVDTPSHHASRRSLGDWLCEQNVPAVTGIDTRYLTRRIRAEGTMAGRLVHAESAEQAARAAAASIAMHDDVFRMVAPHASRFYQGGELEVMLVDVGAKDNIVRSLLSRGASVNRVPWHADLAPHAERADGIVIGNGPGDPTHLGSLVATVRELLDRFHGPIFGICLGNQILSLAAGARTYKLPYGHRSVNQPVQDLLTRRSFITSQNHGFAVDNDSLGGEWEPWFINLNDGTNEGMRSRLRPHFSVQFHPEARPGPQDTGFLFDDFLRLCGAMKKA